MSRPSRARSVVVLVPAVLLALVACSGSGGSSAAAKPSATPLTGAALANQQVGAACSWLAGAEKRPAGSDQAAVGEGMLAHAGTLALTAGSTDPRWKSFAADMSSIGQPGGQPALNRVTAVCAQWDKDHTYYLKHAPHS